MKTVRARDLKAWRAWLIKNHASEKEVWLVFPKTHTRQQTISYEDAVQEALCHGWIDSLIKRIDDRAYARKFTPRTDTKNWSALNKKRVAKLIQEGRMTKTGLAKFVQAGTSGTAAPKPRSLPAKFMEQALKGTPHAWAAFQRLAPSHQRAYTGWIADAKREETRQRRLAEAIRMLAENKKLGLK